MKYGALLSRAAAIETQRTSPGSEHCACFRPRWFWRRGSGDVKRLRLPGALTGLLLCVGTWAEAGPVLDFTGGSDAFVAIGSTFGWEFTVSSPVTVGALGVFDVGADGLAAGHAIGLWTGVGTLLASTTITTANSTPVTSTSPSGDWRSMAIAPLTLAPGDYVVGASYVSGDPDDLFENATVS